MSAFSTLRVSREHALLAYLRLVMPLPTDAQLERCLDVALEDSLYNVRIVADEDAEDDGHYALKSIS